MLSQEQQLMQEFVRCLKQFKTQGYLFPNKKSLRKGTQEEAVAGFISGLIKGHTHGHFEIPTGVGKTAIFIALIHNYLKAAEKVAPGKRVLIVVPSTDLVIQTAKAFAKFMPEVSKLIEADDDKSQQVDWVNSEVGAQYSKLKHAHRKPKILITTYQSLALDSANKIYPPKEYGFIVYDEGHYITGEKFSKSVRKFERSMQLGVTATREYSEDKNVQMYLGYEYFRLPINEAIKRGDLCNVHPILVQTDFSIDQKKFDEFIAQNCGRPLTEKQKDALFNQVARNEAIIETYFMGRDEENNETYFGQTGLIFAAGIKHCSDLQTQLTAAIRLKKYAPLRTWLEREGVALSAEIHSKTKGDILNINGRKRYYSKDEIKELHKQGKILVLISDQELKQGTDYPADSIIMDLVDRYSWVDTKQRYGRGYRLDEDDPSKVCKVFNFIDKNTREIYADSPESLPVYCAETLEGVQFKKTPMRGAFKRFKEKPPLLDKALRSSGFELITDVKRVKYIAAEYQKIRQSSVIEVQGDKTDEWLNKVQFSRELGVRYVNPEFVAFWEKAEAGKVKPLKCGYFKSAHAGRKPFCIHVSEIAHVKKLLGIRADIAGVATEDQLGKYPMAAALGVGDINPKFVEFWDEAKAGKIKWKPALNCGVYRKGPKTIFCIHKDEIPRIKSHLQLDRIPVVIGFKTEEWLGNNELAAYMGVRGVNQHLQEIMDDAKDANKLFKPALKSAYLKLTKGSRVFCIHRSEVERLKLYMDKVQGITMSPKSMDGWLTKLGLATALGMSVNTPIYKQFWAAAADGTLEMKPRLKSGHAKNMENGMVIFYIHKCEIGRVEKYLREQKKSTDHAGNGKYADKISRNRINPIAIAQKKARRGGWEK